MEFVVLSIGLVLIFEGLVFALAPSRLEDLLDALRLVPVEARRLIGLLALVAGVGLVVLYHGLTT
ncbi:DUF2065 domain-containing protein [Palleronia sp. LCG004]|uniref:DUF2065 domain-containing protein n=1 Tax=Palleronia sp. LCG004 TaxID=3079304 RepID=UPI002942F4BB|nr:DUF2065 domain-containing protein [Palleronia sp. LCG004]WOI55654.1 DUF2065 domain-containing protein [Palleronia sp. LCG004]